MTSQSESKKEQETKQQSQWKNNVLQNLQKKQEQLFKQFQERELKLQQIDREEEEFRLRRNQELLFNSNKALFENQDKVRQFKRYLLQSDVF